MPPRAPPSSTSASTSPTPGGRSCRPGDREAFLFFTRNGTHPQRQTFRRFVLEKALTRAGLGGRWVSWLSLRHTAVAERSPPDAMTPSAFVRRASAEPHVAAVCHCTGRTSRPTGRAGGENPHGVGAASHRQEPFPRCPYTTWDSLPERLSAPPHLPKARRRCRPARPDRRGPGRLEDRHVGGAGCHDEHDRLDDEPRLRTRRRIRGARRPIPGAG